MDSSCDSVYMSRDLLNKVAFSEHLVPQKKNASAAFSTLKFMNIAVFINLATLAATPPAPSRPESERKRAGLLTHLLPRIFTTCPVEHVVNPSDMNQRNLETITPWSPAFGLCHVISVCGPANLVLLSIFLNKQSLLTLHCLGRMTFFYAWTMALPFLDPIHTIMYIHIIYTHTIYQYCIAAYYWLWVVISILLLT